MNRRRLAGPGPVEHALTTWVYDDVIDSRSRGGADANSLSTHVSAATLNLPDCYVTILRTAARNLWNAIGPPAATLRSAGPIVTPSGAVWITRSHSYSNVNY